MSNDDAKVLSSEVTFKETNVGGRTLLIPSFKAGWAGWPSWEREMTESIENTLKKGDIFFDVGAADGILSVLWGRVVGGENMVLMESLPDIWPNLKKTWEVNGMPTPRATYCGLLGNKTKVAQTPDFDLGTIDGWPAPALDERYLDAWRCRYLWIGEHATNTPQITIDDFVNQTGIHPAAMSIDCEGAEFLILQGAVKTLKEDRPKVWLALHHADLRADMESKYGYTFNNRDIHKLMTELGYTGTFLADDHEEHWLFQ